MRLRRLYSRFATHNIFKTIFWGGRGSGIHVPTFDAESQSPKIQNSLCLGGGGGGGIGSGIPVLTFHAESQSAKIQIPCVLGGGGSRGSGIHVLTFDAEFKSVTIQNSLCPGGGGGVLDHMRHLVRIWS